jgi:hypothetical protein
MGSGSGSLMFGSFEAGLDGTEKIAAHIVAEPAHPESLALLRYWQDCAAKGGLRLGRDLPAAPIARLMSKLHVFEPLAQNADFRIRLAGTGLIRRFGSDVSGRALSELYSGPVFEDYRSNLAATIESGTPMVIDSRVSQGPNELFHMEYMFVPVLSHDGTQTWVLNGAFYFG